MRPKDAARLGITVAVATGAGLFALGWGLGELAWRHIARGLRSPHERRTVDDALARYEAHAWPHDDVTARDRLAWTSPSP